MGIGVSGCFYFLPLVPVEDNVPPTLVRVSPTRDGTVVLTDRGAVAYIVVSDQDNAEEVTFLWEMTGEGILSGAQTIPDGATRRASQLRLAPEPRYDGATLTVRASDNSGTNVEVSWSVAMQEGAFE
jgi:hypothetical protein